MPKSNGFTLVELLVVIAIMAVISVYTLANYKSFGEDKKLQGAVLDVVSLLRQAQTNATSNTKCATSFGAIWQVEFTNTTTANLKCSTSAITIKPLILANITSSVSGTGSNCPTTPIVNFDPVTGKVGFGDSSCTALTVTLTSGAGSKSLKIEQGGRIYAE